MILVSIAMRETPIRGSVSLANLVKEFTACFRNPLGCLAISIGIGDVGHRIVGLRIRKQLGDTIHDKPWVGSDQLDCSRFDGLEAFGCLAHHEHGLVEGGAFLLNAAGIGEDDSSLVHQSHELQITQGLDQVHIALVAQPSEDRLTNVGIQMDGIDEDRVGNRTTIPSRATASSRQHEF